MKLGLFNIKLKNLFGIRNCIIIRAVRVLALLKSTSLDLENFIRERVLFLSIGQNSTV